MNWADLVDEAEAAALLEAFLTAGGNVVDTSDSYNGGESQLLLGSLLANTDFRDSIVVSARSGSRADTDRRFDLSRRHLLASLDSTLRRLGTDHVDLWQLTAWDPETDIDETLTTVESAIASGKVRYASIGNVSGWQLAVASQRCAPSTVTANHSEYSLLQRGIEREVLPAARHHNLGVFVWSPLGRGVLSGKYRSTTPADSRAAHPKYLSFVSPYLTPAAARITDAVCIAADGLQAAPSQVALAWIRGHAAITTAIVGARTRNQLKVALDSEAVELPDEVFRALEEVSQPTLGYPEVGWNQTRTD